MRRLLFFAVWMQGIVPASAQEIAKTMRRLPDTGQTGSYTATPGEDADYTIHPPFFVVHPDGTATDTVTGLMWQQIDGGEMTFENAQAYCAALMLGGYDDWRLPTAQEAFSILNHGLANPALDGAIFPPSSAAYWWTSDPQANDPNKIWVTNAGGGIGNHPKSETISAGGTKQFHVRAVRDIQAPPVVPARFVDNGDGSISDLLSGLTWQQVPFPDTISWEQALGYAENLVLAGTADWRLPNIKELHSLNDETLTNPSVNTDFFSSIGVKKYWSSTTLPNQNTRAWYLDTRFGITTYDLKTRRLNVICVRGGNDAASATSDAGEEDPPGPTPNPFFSRIRVEPAATGQFYLLIDARGRTVFSGRNPGGEDFSSLAPGPYVLFRLGRTHSQHWKLVKTTKE